MHSVINTDKLKGARDRQTHKDKQVDKDDRHEDGHTNALTEVRDHFVCFLVACPAHDKHTDKSKDRDRSSSSRAVEALWPDDKSRLTV